MMTETAFSYCPRLTCCGWFEGLDRFRQAACSYFGSHVLAMLQAQAVKRSPSRQARWLPMPKLQEMRTGPRGGEWLRVVSSKSETWIAKNQQAKAELQVRMRHLDKKLGWRYDDQTKAMTNDPPSHEEASQEKGHARKARNEEGPE